MSRASAWLAEPLKSPSGEGGAHAKDASQTALVAREQRANDALARDGIVFQRSAREARVRRALFHRCAFRSEERTACGVDLHTRLAGIEAHDRAAVVGHEVDVLAVE